MLRKIMYVGLAIMLIIPTIFTPININAQTLGDLKQELAKYISDYENNVKVKELTESEMVSIRSSIDRINGNIEQIGKDTITLNEEIIALNKSIVDKDREIKEIMNFVQISNGESAYLEYTFGAKDFTDFIYRAAISEQLANYNNRLIKEYNGAIISNDQKKDELAKKKIELKSKQVELGNNLQKLGSQIKEIEAETLSIEDEIDSRKRAINMYENQFGCKDDEDIETCGRNILPPDTAFYRPLVSGSVTANYGWYSPFGYPEFHSALDLADRDNNTPVYASAAGLVVATNRGMSCGNNVVYIQHIVNGARYTTSYWHLRSLSVEVGDRVTKDTKIGIMGGGYGDNDSCSTGAHVHFVVATGLYLSDYHEYWRFQANRIDPRIVLNAPPLYEDFTNRYTRY